MLSSIARMPDAVSCDWKTAKKKKERQGGSIKCGSRETNSCPATTTLHIVDAVNYVAEFESVKKKKEKNREPQKKNCECRCVNIKLQRKKKRITNCADN